LRTQLNSYQYRAFTGANGVRSDSGVRIISGQARIRGGTLGNSELHDLDTSRARTYCHKSLVLYLLLGRMNYAINECQGG
jgi:hypothetical protein